MSNKRHQLGDIVYDEKGYCYYYLSMDFSSDPPIHICRQMIEGEDGEGALVRHSGRVVELKEVFPRPLRHAVDKEIAELQAKAEEARAELRTLQTEVSAAKRENAELLSIVTQNEALSRIADVLAGRITHFVVDEGHASVSVYTAEDALAADRRYASQKLLTLYGNTKGSFAWRLNHYADGSGGDKLVYPFADEESAQAHMRKLIADRLQEAIAKTMEDGKIAYWLGHLIEAADLHGIDVPGEARRLIFGSRLADQKERVAKYEKELSDARRCLLMLEGSLSAIGTETAGQTGANAPA